MSANATPQQDTASQTVAFTVNIQDTCSSTVITFGAFTLTAMSHTVTQAAITQAFIFPTDSLSTTTTLPNVCGAFEYVITQGFTFISIDQAAGVLTVQTTNKALVGSYTATLSASLLDYPAVPPAELMFAVTLVDPCLTTVLTLPTTLVTFTISAYDGVGFTQTFMPATDTAANSALVPDLCGPRTYAVVEA